MAIAVMVEVWEHSQQSGGALLVHLALADNADRETRLAWPSVPNLAKRARLGERQVQNVLRALEESKEITLHKQGGTFEGKRRASVYRVNELPVKAEDPGENIAPDETHDTHSGEMEYTGPGETHDTLTVINNRQDQPSSPPGAPPEPEPDAEPDHGKQAKELVTQLIDRIRAECSTAESESFNGRFARDVKKFLVRGGTAEEVDEAIDRIIERYDDYKLPLKDALDDVSKGKGGNTNGKANQGSGESNITPITPGSGSATHEAGIAALEASNDLRRYAPYAYKYDFASTGGEERPPWPVFANLGGDDDERETNLNRIRTVVKRAVRDAEDTGELKSAMHYIVSYGLEAGDVQVLYADAKQAGWGHAEMAEELERRVARRG